MDIFAAALTRAIREYLCFSSSCLFSRRAVSSTVSVHSAHGCCWHTGESSAWTRLRIINCHFRPSAEVRTCRFSATAAAPRTAKDKDFCWRLPLLSARPWRLPWLRDAASLGTRKRAAEAEAEDVIRSYFSIDVCFDPVAATHR